MQLRASTDWEAGHATWPLIAGLAAVLVVGVIAAIVLVVMRRKGHWRSPTSEPVRR